MYRNKQNDDFQVFDISSKISSEIKPVKWEIGTHITEIKNSDLKFMKDLKEKRIEIGKEHHVAFLHNEDMILVVRFNDKLEKVKHWHIKIGYKDIKKFIFYDKKFYILLPEKIVELSYPDGYDKSFKKNEVVLKREYNDMAMTRNGVFLFIRGFGELIASNNFNPEDSSAIVDKTKFHHGNFISSGYSQFMLNKTHNAAERPSYYYFEDKSGKLDEALVHKKIPDLSLESHHSVRFVETKKYIYYMYPKDSKINFIELYAKESKFGKNLMKNHIHGHVEAIVAGYNSSFQSNWLVIEKQNTKENVSNLLLVYSNFLDSVVECYPIQKSKTHRKLEIKVVTTGPIFNIKLLFGPKPWRKLVKEKPKPEPSHHSSGSSSHKVKPDPKPQPQNQNQNQDKEPFYMPVVKLLVLFTGGFLFTVVVFAFLRYLKGKLFGKNMRETEDIVNEISSETRKEFELNETVESETDTETEYSVDSVDPSFTMKI